jgi:hypothetical protein
VNHGVRERTLGIPANRSGILAELGVDAVTARRDVDLLGLQAHHNRHVPLRDKQEESSHQLTSQLLDAGPAERFQGREVSPSPAGLLDGLIGIEPADDQAAG